MIETSQNAAPDVEKMILGNKCDREEKRQVSKEKGQAVGFYSSSSSSPLPHSSNKLYSAAAGCTNVLFEFCQLMF